MALCLKYIGIRWGIDNHGNRGNWADLALGNDQKLGGFLPDTLFVDHITAQAKKREVQRQKTQNKRQEETGVKHLCELYTGPYFGLGELPYFVCFQGMKTQLVVVEKNMQKSENFP